MITEPFAVIIGILLLIKTIMDNREIKKLKGQIRSLNGMIFKKDGILDTLDLLQKTLKSDLTKKESVHAKGEGC